MEATPFVSVIIPTYHDWDRLKLCLNALAQQSYPIDRFEVLVVNNDPDDRPSYVVASGNVRLLEEAKPGSYAARNAAIRVAKGEVFAFTDSDCIPCDHWIALAVTEFKKNNFVDILVGGVEFFYVNKNKPNSAELFSTAFEMAQERYAKNRRFATANVFIRKSVFDNLGGFNSSLYSGGDFELAKKADDAGYIFKFLSSVNVLHPARSKYSQLIQKARRKTSRVRLEAQQSHVIYVKQILKILYQSLKLFIEISTKRKPVKHKIMMVPALLVYQSAKIFALLLPKETDR